MATELQIAIIQTSLFWENPEQNRKSISDKIDTISMETDMIVLPEMFTTGFTMSPQNIDKNEGKTTLKWMQEKARQQNSAIVGSIPFYTNGAYTNRLFFVEPNSQYHCYDKRHTFTLAGEDKVYRAGSERLIVNYKGFRICPLICYDLRFPVWARNTVDYDILIYVANWPKPRVTAWDTLLKARAIENMAYCIGVNRVGFDETGHEYSGHSAVYDTLGNDLCFSKKESVLTAKLSKEHISTTRNKLKFLADRDSFTLAP
ncbi:amidohydrolase [Costertonia aggregata]|uniref:Omega-amidase YafV n=1 Tax=Costertonia aggregata TaxID=343403 RepID=A0A7H9AQQ7_9FLAO|nr:amidohydrolase [Costertonia aggregata]QLG45575.1 amidohydrolase [Costertonia aggregata]